MHNIDTADVRIYSLTYPSSGGGYVASNLITNKFFTCLIFITGGYFHKFLQTTC